MTTDLSKFAADDIDAAGRAKSFAAEDPLLSIPCSLLSSAEIHDYARITGMLHPFYPSSLKSASYEAHIGGSFVYWDERGRKQEKQIGRGDHCVLPPNSITFVQVEPVFRLPNYIAIRFNLRITHVHRGLLLGTGPLVDPGFEGKLLIPLHNLTSSEYDIDTKEALIWIEFTKTTYGKIPTERLADQSRLFVPFPLDKKGLTPDKYLRKANAGNPIRSSIPIAIEQASRSARRAATTVVGVGVTALVALLAALTALYFQVGGMIQSSVGLSTSIEQGLAPLAADTKATADKITAAQAQMDHLKQQVDELTAEIEKLKQLKPVTQPKTQANRKTPK